MIESKKTHPSAPPWISELPSEWEYRPNKAVMHKVKEIEEKYSANFPILQLSVNGVIKRNLENLFGKRPTTFDGYQYVMPNDLLLCLFDLDVTPRCVGHVKDIGLVSPAYSRFQIHDGYDVRFYYYYYLMLDHTKELDHYTGNLRHSIVADELGHMLVPVPSLAEQQAIADYLDELCAKIDVCTTTKKEQLDQLSSYKRSLISECVCRGVRVLPAEKSPMDDGWIVASFTRYGEAGELACAA